ncbi:unnamed protein product [Acanthoscelides obtectus]|uniref:Uncharacterized protein n=1 Tax=Acanthoscelides obtectus TaxID=200917 RepID=A0A9P0PWK8_ACAOB|nr:unnamed protein product [Acanthoscelides obtectus]CAK1648534.1 hypothetical protein AOBTE_LOCUS15749 [Acanthoscelides obtectus]
MMASFSEQRAAVKFCFLIGVKRGMKGRRFDNIEEVKEKNEGGAVRHF